ncbi:MAG TPA: hypothetical protein VNR65_13070 [Geobacterales bacterium]|nr:hypothetical protein [Geobacterales bacterium]
MSVIGGRAENICSFRVFLSLTRSGSSKEGRYFILIAQDQCWQSAVLLILFLRIVYFAPETSMTEPTKETVIIVHGTWAAPKLEEPAKRRWYEPVDDRPGDEPFPTKLDTALQERGSPARCWKHCTQDDQIFHWSGDNSWIARTRAASELADYVAKLRNEGWCCHIVAHSHGGNVLVDALSQLMAPSNFVEPRGNLATLGTPFMDAMSPVLDR